MGNLPSQCTDEGSLLWILYTSLEEADRAWLMSHGWPGFHAYREHHCASGCVHCLDCEPSCSADFGLYM